jgi:hypothetical protein
MMRMKVWSSIVALVALSVFTGCQPVMIEQTMTTADAVPAVTVTATDEGIQYAGLSGSELPSGLITFTFENERTDAEYAPIIARLNDDTTLEAFKAAATSEDDMSALSLITLYGGRWLQPGGTFSYETKLVPGEYVVLDSNDTGVGEVNPFSVSADNSTDGVDAPEPDVALALQDFAFIMPDIVVAGKQKWHIANEGGQWHEVTILPVPEGTTVDDILNSSDEASTEDEPDVAFEFGPISPGVDAWTDVSLDPGTYVALCFLPDVAGDFEPHMNHGMIRIFTVE